MKIFWLNIQKESSVPVVEELDPNNNKVRLWLLITTLWVYGFLNVFIELVIGSFYTVEPTSTGLVFEFVVLVCMAILVGVISLHLAWKDFKIAKEFKVGYGLWIFGWVAMAILSLIIMI